MIPSTLPDRTDGTRLNPTLTFVTSLSGQPGGLEHRLIEGVVARDPRDADRLARELAEVRDRLAGVHDQRVQRHRHHGRDGDRRKFALLPVEHLGLVRDREVDLVQGDELDRVRRVGGRAEVHREVRVGEVALVLGVVETHVVGVRHPVELDGQRGGRRSAPRGRRPRSYCCCCYRRRRRAQGRTTSPAWRGASCAFGPSVTSFHPSARWVDPRGRPLSFARGRYMAPPLDTHGQSSRSSKLTSPNSAIAISVSSRMQAKMRAVCRFGVDAWIR